MESNAEMLARLNKLTTLRTTVPAWDIELTPESVAAIRWAVRRIAELEGVVKAARARLMPHYECETPCRLCDAVAHIDAVLPERQPCPNCGGFGEYDHEHRDFNGEYLGVERVQCGCGGAALAPAPAKEGEARP